MYVGFAGLVADATDAATAKVSAITETSVIPRVFLSESVRPLPKMAAQPCITACNYPNR